MNYPCNSIQRIKNQKTQKPEKPKSHNGEKMVKKKRIYSLPTKCGSPSV